MICFLDNLLVLPFAHSSDNLTHLYSIGSADSFQLEVKSASKKRKWVEVFKYLNSVVSSKTVNQCVNANMVQKVKHATNVCPFIMIDRGNGERKNIPTSVSVSN